MSIFTVGFLGFVLVQASFADSMLYLSLMLFEHLLKVSSRGHQRSRVVDPVLLGSITLMPNAKLFSHIHVED